MINIVNKYKHTPTCKDIYCGRGSPLGNPFKIDDTFNREDVCDMYEIHLKNLYQERKLTISMKNQLNRIYKMALTGDVNLVCYCAPARCHCESIRRLVEHKLNER